MFELWYAILANPGRLYKYLIAFINELLAIFDTLLYLLLPYNDPYRIDPIHLSFSYSIYRIRDRRVYHKTVRNVFLFRIDYALCPLHAWKESFVRAIFYIFQKSDFNKFYARLFYACLYFSYRLFAKVPFVYIPAIS